jgi:hypothetical protein
MSSLLDATAATLSDEVSEARAALVELCNTDPDSWWQAYELKASARNGWSDGAMNLALSELIEGRELEVDGDRVRLIR